jgi:hypothetical protein
MKSTPSSWKAESRTAKSNEGELAVIKRPATLETTMRNSKRYQMNHVAQNSWEQHKTKQKAPMPQHAVRRSLQNPEDARLNALSTWTASFADDRFHQV